MDKEQLILIITGFLLFINLWLLINGVLFGTNVVSFLSLVTVALILILILFRLKPKRVVKRKKKRKKTKRKKKRKKKK